jgi:nucleoside phosphorylase
MPADAGRTARWLRRHFDDAVAVGTEGSGVAHAAHPAGGLPALVVRGLSDRADAGKSAADPSGSQVAAAGAAAAAVAVIAGPDPDAPQPGRR